MPDSYGPQTGRYRRHAPAPRHARTARAVTGPGARRAPAHAEPRDRRQPGRATATKEPGPTAPEGPAVDRARVAARAR